jgi:hypothetical protein
MWFVVSHNNSNMMLSGSIRRPSAKLLAGSRSLSTAHYDEWLKKARKELKGKDPAPWDTAEGIPLKPLYTAADIDASEQERTPPGVFPFGEINFI